MIEDIDFQPEGSASGRPVDFPPRTTIIDEGEPARAIYRVVSGRVMLSKLLPDGRRQIFEVLGPGAIFGVTPNGKHDSIAETLTETRVSAFERVTAERSPAFGIFVADHLKAQICALHDHAVLLGRKTAVERVASYILDLVEAPSKALPHNAAELAHHNNNVIVHVPMTRSEIADYLGLTLETVSRAFSKLKRDGVVSYERHDGPMRVQFRRLRPLTGTF